ncbi:relaxase/mobilization nuclease domain-containing protein [Arenibacter sp. F20364]|uniref:relaxase/mobilization nuclease domain-containing protein n=1 Tax=Arenibacter sp. F20364 TaxID=2926415 RepID=UPI001FF0E748|nr:relaxase/mobilization nuclease domain-containing protein [Arenibacter sp. F20364]MCK0190807.1 relaxase/mobilization nuclease domain-containing protein [Arenibacter sp. F20364]
MIGIGKSISHTGNSMSYGWNKEKQAEVVYSNHVAGQTPNQITKEFNIIQSQNYQCKKNTLSFVISPTIEDGKQLKAKELNEMTAKFLKEMKLQEHQAIAFVHRNQPHTHVHVYVNRIDFNGTAYNDSFIGKRSQLAAERVAEKMGLTTVREVQLERLEQLLNIRQEIKNVHEKVMNEQRPKDLDNYIKLMKEKNVVVIPSINKSNQLQGFRFQYKGHNLKGSEVHRSMSGSRLVMGIEKHVARSFQQGQSNTVNLMGKATQLSGNIAIKLAKSVIKQAIQKGAGMEIGY